MAHTYNDEGGHAFPVDPDFNYPAGPAGRAMKGLSQRAEIARSVLNAFVINDDSGLIRGDTGSQADIAQLTQKICRRSVELADVLMQKLDQIDP